MINLVLSTYIIFISCAYSQITWSSSDRLPGKVICLEHNNHKNCYSDGNRSNPYKLDKYQLERSIENGSSHALHYPVTVSDLQIPYKTLLRFFKSQDYSPIRHFIFKVAKSASGLKNIEDFFKYIGLSQYPEYEQIENNNLIYNPYRKDKTYMGATIWGEDNKRKLTFSCAACHSADLFGVKVMGLSARFPRANEIFMHGQKALNLASAPILQMMTGASKEELKIFNNSKKAIQSVGLKKPIALGLDTSLAQVGLSLAKRAKDKYATRNKINSLFPRKSKLNHEVADSKPAVWWNVKYKTKFLSDGSLRSGNPIYTNFLWNELGRGTDLKKLEKWLVENQHTVRDLTTYVSQTVAPKFNDFFPNRIHIQKAMRGEKLFLKTCSGCHGRYEKGWSDLNLKSYTEQLRTTKTWYHTQSKVIDVGTDPQRYKGMQYFADDLNSLKLSKTIGTIVTPQVGYIPPPLEGIWARWPYFHNNSAPTLYDVLTPEDLRPKTYYSRHAKNKEVDFDFVRNGYPKKKNKKKFFFDTRKKGLSNKGHTTMMTNKDGSPKFSHEEKLELIEFLKTL